MPSAHPIAERVLDHIPRVENAVSVGEDLDFQRRWWGFEKAAWFVLVLVLIADALGAFGRGWIARGEHHTSDGTLRLQYERIERAGTPSNMLIEFGPSAIHDQKVRLFSSNTIVNELGAQRMIPQPTVSEIGPRGITYTFSTSGSPATVSIALQPSYPGIHPFEIEVPGAEPIRATISGSAMTAYATLLHALAGYIVLLVTIRFLTRRPGSQLTLFEFVLIFFMGGIIITSTMGKDRSVTNATCAVIIVGLLHRSVSYARNRWPRLGALVDGIPLVIYKSGDWQEEIMRRMMIAPEDVLAAARTKGYRGLDEIDYAILERNGQITVLSKQEKS